MTNLNPLELAEKDAKKRLKRAWHTVQDFFKTFTTATLLKMLTGSVVSIALAIINFTAFAAIAVAVVIGVLSVALIYSTKIIKDQDRENRWAYVAGKRVQQDNLDAQIAMDTVTLALMGERHAPNGMRRASRDLQEALAYYQHRLSLAEQRADAAEAVNAGNASDAQRRALKRFQREDAQPPKGPAVEPIKARRVSRDAERKALEAEIQSLATAEDIDAAMKTDEVEGARRTRRERQDAARKADQAARERVRLGRAATAREPASRFDLRMHANGHRDVSMPPPEPTPEQIARGEAQPDPA